MSLVDGIVNNYRSSSKRAIYPNDTTISGGGGSKTLSITRVYQPIAGFNFLGLPIDTWHDVPGGSIVVPAGTHTLGYKIIVNGFHNGNDIPFTQLRIVDDSGTFVPGTHCSTTGRNLNGTSGGGLTDGWGRTQITVALPTTYQLQARRNQFANAQAQTWTGVMTSSLSGNSQDSYIFLDTITYT